MSPVPRVALRAADTQTDTHILTQTRVPIHTLKRMRTGFRSVLYAPAASALWCHCLCMCARWYSRTLTRFSLLPEALSLIHVRRTAIIESRGKVRDPWHLQGRAERPPHACQCAAPRLVPCLRIAYRAAPWHPVAPHRCAPARPCSLRACKLRCTLLHTSDPLPCTAVLWLRWTLHTAAACI